MTDKNDSRIISFLATGEDAFLTIIIATTTFLVAIGMLFGSLESETFLFTLWAEQFRTDLVLDILIGSMILSSVSSFTGALLWRTTTWGSGLMINGNYVMALIWTLSAILYGLSGGFVAAVALGLTKASIATYVATRHLVLGYQQGATRPSEGL